VVDYLLRQILKLVRARRVSRQMPEKRTAGNPVARKVGGSFPVNGAGSSGCCVTFEPTGHHSLDRDSHRLWLSLGLQLSASTGRQVERGGRVSAHAKKALRAATGAGRQHGALQLASSKRANCRIFPFIGAP